MRNVYQQHSAFKVYPLLCYSGRSDLRQKGTSKIWLGLALWSAWSPNKGRPNGTLPNGTAEAPLRVEALSYVRSHGRVGALQLTAGDCPTNDHKTGMRMPSQIP